jgi:hypothetical protein
LAVLVLLAPAPPAPAATPSKNPGRLTDPYSSDAVLRWIWTYRSHPDPKSLPVAVRALSRFGAFKDPESAGVFVGFMAGVLGSNPRQAETLIAKTLPLPPEDDWVVVRAIAYSGLPTWRELLENVSDRLPTRQVMIEKYRNGKMLTLFEATLKKKSPTLRERIHDYFAGKEKDKDKPVPLDPSPELLDTFWGYYFATGTHRPVMRIIAMLPMSRDDDSVDTLTLGSMAKYTLASNAARTPELLAMIKRVRELEPKEVQKVLDEVIDAAETVNTASIRKEALASIEDLRRKGPGYKRNVSRWGQIGQGALALGCIGAAASGMVALGLPCVVGGAASSAALNYWEKNN